MGDDRGSLLDRLRFLSRIDWRNAKNGRNAFEVGLGLRGTRLRDIPGEVLDRAWMTDFGYNREYMTGPLRTLVRNAFREEEMNAFQKEGKEGGYVSTPLDSAGAGITTEGRMSSFTHPAEAANHQLPYYPGGNEPTPDGSKPGEGGFGGIITDGDVTWLWEDAYQHRIGYRDRSGILDLSYTPNTPLPHAVAEGVDADLPDRYLQDLPAVEEATYTVPGEETIVRDYTIRNDSEQVQDGRFVYYTRANVTDELQNPIVWRSHRNRLVAGDALHWEGLQSGERLRVEADRDPDGSGAVEDGFEDVLDMGQTVVEGRYLDGMLGFDYTLEPGEETTVSIAVHGDDTPAPVLGSGHEKRQDAVERWWTDWLADVDTTGMDPVDNAQYTRATATLGMISDPESGALPAAPNLKPMYYPSWIRDGAFSAVALARAGKPEPAKRYLAEFCPGVQEGPRRVPLLENLPGIKRKDGSFRMCYGADGGFAGYIENENDQQSIYVWAVDQVYRETGDEDFLKAAWPTVKRALDYTMDVVQDNDLLAASPDYAEMPLDVRQGLWTNTFAYRALLDGADLAEEMGEAGGPYREAADRIGAAVRETFFPGDGTDYSTLVSFRGHERDLNSPEAAAVWPTRWDGSDHATTPIASGHSHAEGYGGMDRGVATVTLLDDLYRQGVESDGFWAPGAGILTGALYHAGQGEAGDRMKEKLLSEQTPAGNLPEHIEDGDHAYASPLGWAQASYILAADEKYR